MTKTEKTLFRLLVVFLYIVFVFIPVLDDTSWYFLGEFLKALFFVTLIACFLFYNVIKPILAYFKLLTVSKIILCILFLLTFLESVFFYKTIIDRHYRIYTQDAIFISLIEVVFCGILYYIMPKIFDKVQHQYAGIAVTSFMFSTLFYAKWKFFIIISGLTFTGLLMFANFLKNKLEFKP